MSTSNPKCGEGTGTSAMAVIRAALPFLVRTTDLAIHLPITEQEARTLLESGFGGPPLWVKGEPVVSRDRLVAAIEHWASSGRDVLDLFGGEEVRP